MQGLKNFPLQAERLLIGATRDRLASLIQLPDIVGRKFLVVISELP